MKHRATYRHSLLAMLAGLFSAGANAGETGYRLAGTMAIDADRTFAVIETSAGTQALYRVGDTIADWTVDAIDDRQVVLGRNGETVALQLEGSPVTLEELAAAAEPPVELVTTTASLNFGRAYVQLQALEERRGAGEVSYSAVNRVLGLGESERIAEIDGQPVPTPMAMLSMSKVALAAEMPFRLVMSEGRADEMYLLPVE